MKRFLITFAIISLLIPLNCLAKSQICCSSSCAEIMKRSILNKGNSTRLQHVFAKASRKEPIVIGVIGGSITEGAAATKSENRYGNRVHKWWQQRFPQTEIKFVNAGIGATASDMGSHRATSHLLSYEPDFVIVEYAVNDRDRIMIKETMEGLLRQILSSSKTPAVMLLMMCDNKGYSTQSQHAEIGKYYDLPMISFQDALCPEVQAGKIKWEDIEHDSVHPNDKGHQYAAKFITAYLESVLEKTDMSAGLPVISSQLPAPKITNTFQYTQFMTSQNAFYSKCSGWSKDMKGCIYSSFFGNGWLSSQPGATLAFEVDGTTFGVVFHHVKGDVGMIQVTVDDEKPVKVDAYFAADWGGGFPKFQLIAKDLQPGSHKVEIKLLEEKNKNSSGNKFRLMAITAAGQ